MAVHDGILSPSDVLARAAKLNATVPSQVVPSVGITLGHVGSRAHGHVDPLEQILLVDRLES